MSLQQQLKSAFPDGLPYDEATQLCQQLFCTVEGLPANLGPECTMEGIASAFASLSREGWVSRVPASAAAKVDAPQHWFAIIRLVLTVRDLDMSLGERARDRLLRTHTSTRGGNI
jgi:hypothetical protein